jgi:hypothetical protein
VDPIFRPTLYNRGEEEVIHMGGHPKTIIHRTKTERNMFVKPSRVDNPILGIKKACKRVQAQVKHLNHPFCTGNRQGPRTRTGNVSSLCVAQ